MNSASSRKSRGKRPRYRKLLRKSTQALLAAVEIYNKPNFEFREESFAVLMIVAWELLLKAKILKDNENRGSSIFVYKKGNDRHLKKNQMSGRRRKPRIERTHSGQPKTIGVSECIARLRKGHKPLLSPEIEGNLFALIEYRNTSCHLVNTTENLARAIHSIGTASLKNYVILSEEWFRNEMDLERYSFYLMPIAFMKGSIDRVEVLRLTGKRVSAEQDFLSYLQSIHAQTSNDPDGRYAFALGLNVSFSKAPDQITKVRISKDDPQAIPLVLREEDILERYPHRYGKLLKLFKVRYYDFDYNTFKKQMNDLKKNNRFAIIRQLDPSNSKSNKVTLYSPAVIDEFDKIFRRK